jgi:S2P endopeptidase
MLIGSLFPLPTLGFETSRWNRWLAGLAEMHRRRRSLLETWFRCGVAVGGIGLAVSLTLLAVNIARLGSILWQSVSVQHFTGASNVQAAVITPIIPGITVPTTDLACFWGAVLCAVTFHELGHAMAAGVQRIPIISVGFFVSAVVPGAYVSVSFSHAFAFTLYTSVQVRIESTLSQLSPLQQLSVYCAGVWHNLVSWLLHVTEYVLFAADPSLLLSHRCFVCSA